MDYISLNIEQREDLDISSRESLEKFKLFPYRVYLRYGNPAGKPDYTTIGYVSEETARDIAKAGKAIFFKPKK